MDDERKLALVRQRDLRRERLPLDGAGRVVVVVVQAALANGHDARRVEQADDRFDPVDRVVRVEPDGRPHVVVGGGDVDGGRAAVGIRADRDEAGDPGLPGGGQRGLGAARDPVVVDVAVVVEPAHDPAPPLRPNGGGTAGLPW